MITRHLQSQAFGNCKPSGYKAVAMVQRFQLGQKVWERELKCDGKGYVPVPTPRWTESYVTHSVYDRKIYTLRKSGIL